MPKPTLIVMAAGLGTRYGGLKPVAPVGPNGEAAVEYSVYDALKAGFGRIVFVIRKAMEGAFRERVGKLIEGKTDAAYVFQELDRLPPGFHVPPGREKPWGTGHAILCCREAVTTPFAVINADDFYGRTSYEVLAGHLVENDGAWRATLRRGRASDATERVPPHESQKPASYCKAGFVLKNTLSPHGAVARGVCGVTPDGFLWRVTERTKIQRVAERIQYADDVGQWVEISGDTIVSMNMWGFTPGIFEELEQGFAAFLKYNAGNLQAEYYIPSVVDDLIDEGLARVKVLRTDEKWFGLTYREDLSEAQCAVRELIRRGAYPERLWQ